MKQKVDIHVEIFAETQARYPHIDFNKFKILYYCWRVQGLRKKLHSGSFYTLGWTRGWLSQKAADSFREYIGLR